MNLKRIKQIKDTTFRRNDIVRATLPNGRTLEEATYVEPYSVNKHTIKYNNQLYGVDEASLEKIKGQYANRKRYYSQKERDNIYNKAKDLEYQYNDLKERRRQLSIDMEEEYGHELNTNNNADVLDEISQRYGGELNDIDEQLANTSQQYKQLRQKHNTLF